MSHETDKAGSAYPTPMILTRKSAPKSLNLENVDMSKDGRQGDVVVSKGKSSTFVSVANKDVEG